MALRRVVSPNQFYRPTSTDVTDTNVYSDPRVKASTKGAVYGIQTVPTYTDTSNPFNFTPGQVSNNFQSSNIVGQQYPWLHEAPSSYLPSSQADMDFDDQFGMLGSLFGPHIRQAMNTPLVMRDPITGQVAGNFLGMTGGLTVNVSIDESLTEKQYTYGTPDYFRRIAMDMRPSDNNMLLSPIYAAMGWSSSVVNAQQDREVLRTAKPSDTKTYYVTGMGVSSRSYDYAPTPTVYRSPEAAASYAISGGYSSNVTSYNVGTPALDTELRKLVHPDALAVRNAPGYGGLGPYDVFDNLGTGQFHTQTHVVTGTWKPPSIPYPTSSNSSASFSYSSGLIK